MNSDIEIKSRVKNRFLISNFFVVKHSVAKDQKTKLFHCVWRPRSNSLIFLFDKLSRFASCLLLLGSTMTYTVARSNRS